MGPSTSFDAVIVGGGHNGLVTSWYLANAGLKVLVLERRGLVGGACVTEELWPGFRVPTCAYVCYLLQEKVIDDMELRRHGFHVFQPVSGNLALYPDGRYLLGSPDKLEMARRIGQISAADAEAYPRYLDLATRFGAILKRYMLTPAPSIEQIRSDLEGTGDESLLDRLLIGSITDLLDDHFESPEVKAHFVAAYEAGDPSAPGSLLTRAYEWVSLHTPDENYGIVRGGMGGITLAMESAAREAGVVIRTDTEVTEIETTDGKAIGVRTTTGERFSAPIIVSNADPKRTFSRLVSSSGLPPSFSERVNQLKTEVSFFKFHASLNELPDLSRYLGENYDPRWLARIRICPSVDYFKKSWHDSLAGLITDSPIMAVQIPTVYDDTLTDKGGHVLSIWSSYAPVLPAGGTWDDLRQTAGEAIIDTLTTYAPNFRNSIRDWTLFTPIDIERRSGMTDGNVRHLDMVSGQLFADRPLPGWSDYRTPIEGLYLCGAGTHPGGEVTGAPGHNAARAILRDVRSDTIKS